MAKPTHTKIIGSPAHRDHHRDFVTLISGVARREGWREAETFDKWLTAAAAALAGPALKDFFPERFERSEARYMEVVKASRHPAETMDDLSQALAICTAALEAEASDFVGPVFSELSANARAGQFFTPWHVSEMMARTILSDAERILEDQRARGRNFITLQEPACGPGGMALAANSVLRELGICPSRRAHWTCIDIDWRCFCACYIQLTLTGASATVIHGNALSLEVWEAFPTITAVLFPKREPKEPPQAEAAPALEEEPQLEPPPVANLKPGGQMDFGF